ncbi:MAG: hypothetical protein HY751_09920 [Nitrospinae bacterium]|nr:hypothetical protein [Nitrospinota bacterium]
MSFFTSVFKRRNRRKIERFLGRKLVETHMREVWINTLAGVKLCAHLHTPLEPRSKLPGVVFVPGGESAGLDYDEKGEMSAHEVAGLGYAVLTYDPSGRGKSGGKENFWGASHQRELKEVIEWFGAQPEVDADDMGVLSFSIGVVIATGALAMGPSVKVRYLYDWEGPSNSKVITKNDTHRPLLRFPSADREFWDEREASRYIGRINCGYFRYQADMDHVQGKFKGHAIELVNGAVNGRATWVRLNDNQPDITLDGNRPDEYRWIPEERNHRGQMLKFLLELRHV